MQRTRRWGSGSTVWPAARSGRMHVIPAFTALPAAVSLLLMCVHCCRSSLMQRTFREIMFLQELNNHENIIRCGSSTWCLLLHRIQAMPPALGTALPHRLSLHSDAAAGCSTCSKQTTTGEAAA